jgi:hypothetical protein
VNPTYLGLPLLNEEQATLLGHRSMTFGYMVPREDWMLASVIADLQRGRIKFSLVQVGLSVEVWR